MYCSNCGARVPDGADFCAACGASVREIPSQRPEYSRARQRGNSSVIIIALIAVAVVLVAAIICFTILTRAKQQAQMAAIQAEQTAQTEQIEDTQETTADVTQAETTAEDEDETEEAEDSAAATTTVNNYYYYNTTNRTDDYYSKVGDSGYLWPTDTMYISSSDLSGLGQDTVAAIRNEIYARHGYAFETERWKEYFSTKSWYVRDSSCTESTVTARLSSIEKANVDTIVAYEESMGWR